MEKILVIIDAKEVNTATIEFAAYIARLTGSKLTGLFLKNKDAEPAFSLPKPQKHFTASELISSKITNRCIDDNVQFFIKACERRGVHSEVSIEGQTETNKSSPLEEAVDESRFSDLAILDANTSLKDEAEALPTNFVKKFLNEAECPVVLAPAEFNGIDEVIFCYDGSKSAVFAIKQFCYLFPQFSKKKLTVLEVEDKIEHSRRKEKMLEWLQRHYRDVNFHLLKGTASDELLKYLLGKKDSFVVMGAYGRSTLSNFFKKSSANLIIQVVDVPLFISHH